MYDRAVVYSKSNCPYCNQAIIELTKRNIPFIKYTLGEDISREELLEKVPNAKTVPQIFLYINSKEVYIGGYEQLMKEFNNATDGTTD